MQNNKKYYTKCNGNKILTKYVPKLTAVTTVRLHDFLVLSLFFQQKRLTLHQRNDVCRHCLNLSNISEQWITML